MSPRDLSAARLRSVRLSPVLLWPVLLLAAGCGLFTGPEGGPPAEITELPRQLSPAERELIRSGNAFGLELLGRLVEGAGPGDFFVEWVKQKSFVRVDEEGTEAAAATGTGIGPVSAPPVVRVDRPFLFAIRERLSGTILFLGAVDDPTSG